MFNFLNYKILSLSISFLKVCLILAFIIGIYYYVFKPIKTNLAQRNEFWRRVVVKNIGYLILFVCIGFHFLDLQKFYLEKKIFESQFNKSFERVEIGHLYNFQPEAYFKKRGFENSKYEKFQMLTDILRTDFVKNENYLKTVLPFENKKLIAVYLMSFVSTLWPYGNKDDPKSAGCIFNNELDRSRTYSGKSFSQYIRSPIGCCTDYAFLLKALLDRFEVENVTVHVGGHVFNQVNVDGEYLTLDANTNFVYLDAWDSIQNNAKKFQLLILPHPSSDKSSMFYRPLQAYFQYEMSSVALRGGVKTELSNKLPEHIEELLK